MNAAETAAVDTEAATVVRPEGLGAIRVAGPEAGAFLNAQLSNEIPRLEDHRSALAAWCDAKGRTLAVLRVVPESEEDFLLILPAERVDPVLKRLRMFVLRAKVRLEDASADTAMLGLLGSRAETLLGQYLTPPDAADGLRLVGNLAVTRMPGPDTRFLVVGPPDSVAALAGQLTGDADANPSHVSRLTSHHQAWRLAEIRSGLPQIHAATQGLFVPQMLNLHRLGAVDFQKGCYPGQEVVARLQHRGKLKRCLYRAALPGPPPAPGEDVIGPDGVREGTVIEAAASPGGGSELLAVIRIAAADKELSVGSGQLAVEEGARVQGPGAREDKV